MSSANRERAQKKTALTRFVKPESPCYLETDDNDYLFPFTYSNGVLDISYSGNNFKARMVDISGNSPNSETETAVRIMSGPYLVSSLGDNFKEYIRSWRSSTIDSGSPIEIYSAPQVIRVQEADVNNMNANSGEAYLVSTKPPAIDSYASGSASNSYNKKCVFKTPLTFTIVESGVTQYITFRTIMDQE